MRRVRPEARKREFRRTLPRRKKAGRAILERYRSGPEAGVSPSPGRDVPEGSAVPFGAEDAPGEPGRKGLNE